MSHLRGDTNTPDPTDTTCRRTGCDVRRETDMTETIAQGLQPVDSRPSLCHVTETQTIRQAALPERLHSPPKPSHEAICVTRHARFLNVSATHRDEAIPFASVRREAVGLLKLEQRTPQAGHTLWTAEPHPCDTRDQESTRPSRAACGEYSHACFPTNAPVPLAATTGSFRPASLAGCLRLRFRWPHAEETLPFRPILTLPIDRQ